MPQIDNLFPSCRRALAAAERLQAAAKDAVIASGGSVVVLGMSRWTETGPCEASNSAPCWGEIMPLTGVAEGAVVDASADFRYSAAEGFSAVYLTGGGTAVTRVGKPAPPPLATVTDTSELD